MGFPETGLERNYYDGDFNVKNHMPVKFRLVARFAAVVLCDVFDFIQSVECFGWICQLSPWIPVFFSLWLGVFEKIVELVVFLMVSNL